MTERQQSILKTVIEEYIKDANPVGSKKLAEGFDFGIGPAMIRQELVTLEKAGYLVSPHTSAGRVPTDMAYRLYISRGFQKIPAVLSKKDQKRVDEVIYDKDDYSNLLKEVSRLAASLSKEFSISGLVGQGPVYTYGLKQLFDEPELKDIGHVNQLIRFMDEIDNYFDSIWDSFLHQDMRVFIGRENPTREIQDFSVITGQYQLPRGESEYQTAPGLTGFVSIIGPRRMDYRKNMALVEYISDTIDNLI